MPDRLRLACAMLLLLFEAAVAGFALHPKVSPAYRAFFIDHTTDAWPPCRAAASEIAPRGPIDPSRLSPGAACALLRYGWSRPESWGVWNQGPVARLAVPYGPEQHRLTLRLIAHARPGGAQGLVLLVNGRRASRAAIPAGAATTLGVTLPPATGPATATIELRIATPYSPRSRGEGPDLRPLGVGLLGIGRD